MWPSERYTQRRGRSVVPETLVRTRACTRLRCRSRDNFLTLADATVVSFALRRRAAGLGASLARFLLQALTGDANTFLLVGIGRTQRANVRGHLADLPLVRATDHDVRLFVHRDLNAFGNLEFDRVRFAEREGHQFAFELRAIADAHDVQILLEALRHAVHRVGHQRARESMQRAMLFGGALGEQHPIFLLESDAERHTDVQLALGALDFDLAALQRDFHALRDRNGFVADA